MTLLSVQTTGLAWTIALFLLVLVCVHAAKLVASRFFFKKQPPPPAEKEAEPVYYLVERKKKRPKKQYTEPKEITFK